MKKIIIVLVAIILVLVTSMLLVGNKSSLTLYKDAPKLTYDEIYEHTDGTNLFYIYQDDCPHCIEIKGDVAKFYYNKPDNINFYLVDGKDIDNNGNIWFDKSTGDFIEPSGPIDTKEDIKIKGTPTLIEITDNEVTQFLVGSADIPEYLESLNE